MSSPGVGRMGAAAIAALLLAACAPDPVVVQPTDPATTVQPDTSVERSAAPEPVVPDSWPLTGIEGEVTARVAVAVKIENSSAARPQSGLEHADVVWEEMVEGGITRFNAVFNSSMPEGIGPIRSVRPMDAAIAAPLHGLLAFSGGQGVFIDQMIDAGLQVLDNDAGDPGMYRVSFRAMPHNVYGDVPVMADAAHADRAVPPPQQFAFTFGQQEPSAAAGSPTARIDLGFPAASPGWEWSAGESAWLRSERGAPSYSADDVRLSAANVVVLRVRVTNDGGVDPAGNPIPVTHLEGEGEALVASAGRSIEARWTKGAADEVLELVDGEGEEVLLEPGTTWVELLPLESSMSVS
ncbi:DUF3048 domain-containing protein [Serinibacter salmoneus]|uniref:DUF3048 family protein n=1 Tax=Serinibacter salmoneus TaxID=556530 RepID=A0A2A9D2U4_9MICO|nr:DUF3048 domain-containing protein [Serinibacter salmoneus]PFG20565.1 Protein of unknown function (DUF3048) [Serinibacter salmoneus]